MKKKKNLLVLALLLWTISGYAAKVDTLLVKSPAMNKNVEVVVVVPDAGLGKKATACPVIYLLHGYGGNAKTWIQLKRNLPQIADEKGIIFVCPDGKNSWYWDSPKDPAYRYETFISSELVNYIDGHYKTVADRKGRAITGLSMGGHGAMWNALRHKDTFGGAGSTSVEWIFARSR
ncbi:acetyl esterase [Bacteroides reticulotermitis JCM 10512]|uniref:Acetyl esterase n=1 Tax=Bacteroides reticulotermitis JCM 10512 TaxID=1445607 RepID=W4UQ41_9BACE|nr:acetyl esterase [Bacteroides reticulotermitis JCM 10512]